MILHGIEVPTIKHDNTLTRSLLDYGTSDMVDAVMTNPPFGGTEEPGIEMNFPALFRTRKNCSNSFSQSYIWILRKLRFRQRIT